MPIKFIKYNYRNSFCRITKELITKEIIVVLYKNYPTQCNHKLEKDVFMIA